VNLTSRHILIKKNILKLRIRENEGILLQDEHSTEYSDYTQCTLTVRAMYSTVFLNQQLFRYKCTVMPTSVNLA
jgi:hypothetical protein